MAEILIIDDDKIMAYAMARMVRHLGHSVINAYTLKEGLNYALLNAFDAIFLDVRLPDGNGLDIIPELRATIYSPEIIIITAYSDPGGAEVALKSGVWDYIEKPSRISEIELHLMRVLEYRKQKMAAQTPFNVDRCGIVGNSTQMSYCIDLMAQAAAAEANVLISGETGTGKELFARAIHLNSSRCGKSFVVLDCAALPEHLVESILFGHVQGAFTSADKASEGLVKQADGGSLFLDEVGELPCNLQKAFLRVLQEHRFRPVGGKKELYSDFRLIAATNRDLDISSQNGAFRTDLLHRLRTLSIELPPLCERKADIKELVLHTVANLCTEYGMKSKGFAPGFLDVLTEYNWPGNVRELINVLESALNAAIYEPILFPIHLPANIRTHVAVNAMRENPLTIHDTGADWRTGKDLQPLKTVLEDTKREYMEKLIKLAGGRMTDACRISGLSRASLYNYFKKYGMAISKGPSLQISPADLNKQHICRPDK